LAGRVNVTIYTGLVTYYSSTWASDSLQPNSVV